jgi:hypothetical protein
MPNSLPARKNVLADPKRVAKLLEFVASLPEVRVELAGEQHLKFTVRKKSLAYFCDDHHGDGIVAVWAKSTRLRQQELVTQFPKRFFVPPYVGPSGWVGLRLDQRAVDWGEVAQLLISAYRLQAPRKLADQIG